MYYVLLLKQTTSQYTSFIFTFEMVTKKWLKWNYSEALRFSGVKDFDFHLGLTKKN